MTGRGLVVDRRSLGTRRAFARGPLAPLSDSLAADLHAAANRPLFVPTEKARLTRVGGRCAVDGALLAFDPFEPRRHTCSLCGRTYDDEAHYRWWIMWYQLWLAERAVHGATLGLLRDDVPARVFATQILDALADLYLTYPNRDNVLGPTRPFFSTYLESIWLLQLCAALDLLELDERADVAALGARVRDRVVEPSRALVAQYDEGRSNRQIWNAVALAAAARLLDDDSGVERALLGRSGVAAHLGDGLLADGTWYEGENYHQFAHRGLWYGATIAAGAGIEIPPSLLARLDAGFATPLLTAFPDLTLPARRDSQWASSLRQWRWAEWCELGLARADDDRLAATLATLYAEDVLPRSDTGRWRTAAESERNEAPTSLTRADLGWKSLLHANADVRGAAWTPPSVLLDAQGLAVFRRDAGRRWVGIDYGASGGGHGHPDRLNALLIDGPRRWLDDMGTGSYVDRSLHWYRSTLAHNAPLVDGRSQRRADGALEAYADDGTWGWCLASAAIAPGVSARRALVVGPSYVVDHVEWQADRDVTFDLPVHVDADVVGTPAWTATDVVGAGHLEDGFDFLSDTFVAPIQAREAIELRAPASRAVTPRLAAGRAPAEASGCRAWIVVSHDATLIRATGPGAPGQGNRRFHVVRLRGRLGAITTVWDVGGAVARVEPSDAGGIIVRHAGTSVVDLHRLTNREWHLSTHDGAVQRRRLLGGARRAESMREPAVGTAATRAPRRAAPRGRPRPTFALGRTPLEFALGEAHYRRTEQSWREAGRPSAHVSMRRADDTIVVETRVPHASPTFVAAGTENPLDTERAEVNGDGVQLYVQPDGADDSLRGWLLVPEPGSDAVRVIALAPSSARLAVVARWHRDADGYTIVASIPLGAIGGDGASSFGFDLVVNETVPGRERRRGQLVLSGARGEFAYLQGDRHDAARLVVVELTRSRP